MSLIKENDGNLLLGAFFPLVTGSALGGVEARALFLELWGLSVFPLVGPFMRCDPPPERFGSSVILVALVRMRFNLGHIGAHVLIIKRFEVPVLEKRTLGTEGSTRGSIRKTGERTWNISISRAISLVFTDPPIALAQSS